MNFGNKLLRLRKEKGMSQEALSEKLNTSRQAISKWENGQGFPETEKLLLIGNIFNVSIDYLLKDTLEQDIENKKGYYASKEVIEGYLINEKKSHKYLSLGISLLILSYIPYLIFKQSFEIYSVIITVMVTLGFGLIIKSSFMNDEYEFLRKEPLIFDKNFLKEFTEKYSLLIKRYVTLIIIGICFIFAGGTILLLLEGLVDRINVYFYQLIYTLMISIGAYPFIYFYSIMDSYELIVKNEEYTNKLSFKILKKFRDKKSMI
ncbi:helix-turn-helix domain-containing protein [Paraclostridium sordellii]|uniref:helix-turn-helix domain-containing protein n=1 Tax=Paraclostridium sordellii TaxID=1505 RepID=UPI0005E53365|nr:helix-turn-helix transcriptional regulator [Paeniclostridium sordellii]CEN93533.1 XRE family transcriptional regulator [[Clostridium] sordellii] [Paeniclostridium sordellii]CEN95221.1 XRE family transcriptional regulator [[Clostridium] sordellii] [Paeniclostridium sordellii]